MKNIIKAQRGTADILPNQSYKWRYVERIFAEVATVFGFKEIRTPVFEATELFARGVGDGTDIVQKEMYTFDDKGGRSVTLRPEGTAGVVRAVIENSLLSQSMPLKVFYIITAYRYEKPQKGRGREFHQLGAEIFGADFPAADIRLIDF
ncbi:MAG: ATP phosphoribosyltransferase regulatory subunit, partial [Oscillospiraceae bacterium]|nr:ATP phosphoribosyltransferase regulatory subunit [Oscillospiraceae bacterium]